MNNQLLNVVNLARQGQPVSVTKLAKENPLLAAVVSKMIQGQNPAEHTSTGERKITAPDDHALNQIATSISRNTRENKSLMQMLPDLELGFQILISACSAPKDMVTMELVIETGLRSLSPNISGKLVQVIREFLDNTYKIKNKIPDILRDIFQITGSHILAVLPENAIDELINRHGSISMEDYQNVMKSSDFTRELGLLGPGQRVGKQTAKRDVGPVATFSTLTGGLENMSYYDIDAGRHTSNQRKLVLLDQKGEGVEFESVTITDNPNVLRNGRLVESLRRRVIESKLNNNNIHAGLENFKLATGATQLTDKILTDLIYKPRRSVGKRMEILRPQSQQLRSSIGAPLVLNLPSESVIPVTTPGDESKHVGYFILLDDTGYPIRSNQMIDGYGALAQRLQPNQSQNASMLNRLQALNNGIPCSNYMDAQRSVRIYSDLLEQDLLASLNNGMFANGAALAQVDDAYRILLARKLQNQRTTILFLPVETVTYFALRFNENGVGVSLLDEMKIINSQRAVLMFANTMAGITNSMDLTDVEIKLDEDDPDPQDTVEKVMDAIVRANTTMFPLGVDSPSDIVSYLAKAQYAIKYSGHPGMPDMSIDTTHKQAQRGKVDTELQEQLRKYSYAAIGLTLEHVDNGFNQQTATSVVADSLMLSRRVSTIQETFNPHLTDHIRKVIRAWQPLCEELREVIKSNLESMKIDVEAVQKQLGDGVDATAVIVERILSDFVNSLDFSLPRPNMATQKAQKEALAEYKALLNEGISAYISSDMFSSEIMGEVSTTVEGFRKIVEAYFIRRYCSNNGILSELADLVDVDDDGFASTDVFAQITEHVQKLMKSSGEFIKRINHEKHTVTNLLEKLANSGDPSSTSTDTPAPTESTGDDLSDPFADMGDPFAEKGDKSSAGPDSGEAPKEEPPKDEDGAGGSPNAEPPTV